LSSIFVDDSNLPGPGTGTAADPFVLIQNGINAAASGDEVKVAPGIYNENIVMKTGVDVLGAGADQTTIVGAASVNGVVLFDGVTDSTLSRFTLTVSAPIPGVDRAVVFQGTTDATAVLEWCVITGTQYGIFTSVPAMIRNNTLVGDIDEQGIYVGNNPTDATIQNNIIVGYSVAGIHIVAGATPPTPIIKFNDVFNNGANYQNFADQTGINGNISADPLFVPAPPFHLQAGSPAINAGDPASPLDSDGSRADMGAFPFAPPVTLSMPAAPLFVGEFVKVPVSIGAASGLTFADLRFDVLEGPPGGEVSTSRDASFNPAMPDIMLLGGFQEGTYHLQAIRSATGTVVGTGDFSITSFDTNDELGPGLWVDGEVQQQFVAGAAWGGGPAGPQNVNVVPATGTRRVALLFVDTATQRYTSDAPTLQGFRDRWEDETEDGVATGGKTFSVNHFYREVSYNNFNITADPYGPVNLSGNWTDYFVADANGNWAPRSQLWSAGITAGDTLINYNNYDSVVFVSQEVPANAMAGTPFMFAWPYANGNTFSTAEGNKTLGVISMPNQWGTASTGGANRHIHETLSHELGHNIGLPDLYTPSVPMPNPNPADQTRNVVGFDMMHRDNVLPHFSVAHRMMLGWVNPGWIQTFNFANAGGPVDQTVTLSPIENGAPPAGRFVGLEIRIADGLNYYCEYRRAQAAQIGDQIDNPNNVVCTDVASPPYVAPIARPTILLVPNDTDMDGSVLSNGGDFEQTDFSTPGFPVEFKLDVSGIDGAKADVRVRYGVNSRPDPSIRPWPASADREWQSPDIEVKNARNMADPAWFNVPWVGNPNTVVAKIKNNGNIGAPGVRADFFVKDYTVGGAPETFIGSDTKNIGAGATVEFTAPWTPPASGHFCIIVRIPLYQVPPMTGILELSGTNNEAQSNYDRFISATGSPASREISSMTVGNPYSERTSVFLTVSQTNPAYRTYIGNRWVTLNPGETKQIPLMFEFAGDGFLTGGGGPSLPPGQGDSVSQILKRAPNDVQIIGLIRNPDSPDPHAWTLFDGGQVQVVTGRATEFEDFRQDMQRTVAGRVVTRDNGSAVPGGKVLVKLTSASGQDISYVEAAVAPSGLFQAVVTGGWKKAVAYYLPPNGFGEATSQEIENREINEIDLPFAITGPNSVPFHLFSVITTGRIEAQVEWPGGRELTVGLAGRAPNHANENESPFPLVAGKSPLVISRIVEPEDLLRGVNWRLTIMDPSGGDATGVKGTIHLTTPADSAIHPKFERERIELRSGDFWPSAALTSQFIADLATSTSGGRHGLISLTRTCTCYDTLRLERAGVSRQSFLPGNNAFGLVRAGTNLADPFLLGAIRAITPLEPEDKIDPNILLGNFEPFTILEDTDSLPIFRNFVLNPDGTLDLAVLFAQDTSLKRIVEILRTETNDFVPITDLLWQVNIAPDRLIPLAAHDEVEWVDPGLNPGSPDNNQSRATLNVNPVQNATTTAGTPPTINYAGLSGNGITIGIQDTGIGAHVDLNVVGSINPNAVGTHGSHVAGTAAGSGLQSSQNNANGNPNGGTPFQFRGMAPQAAILSGGDLFNAGSMLNAIQNFSLDVTNRSQSFSFDGQYGAQDQTIDQFIRGGASSGGTAILRRPWVISAGNHGTFPANQRPAVPPGLAPGTTQLINGGQIGYYSITKQLKNAIMVGNWNFGQLAQSSSMGPAYDGRIKPDVVAPGTNVISTGIAAGNVSCPLGVGNDYVSCSGTSMASPAVAGILALLLQGWQNTYNAASGATIDANPPLPATLRAIVIDTATDIVNNNVRGAASVDVDGDSNQANNGGVADGLGTPSATAGPDYTTGWGLVNAQAAAQLLQNARMENGVPVPNQIVQDAASQGRIIDYDFVVDQAFINAGQPLRVTIAWDDVEAALQNVATNPTLVNDLDLELIAPDGTVFYPWQLGHTILDAMGNPLANNAQPPGTPIQIQRAITPINNPTFTFQAAQCAGGVCQAWGAGFPGNIDYVPANALAGNGVWVATTGKDHLNNVEQVQVNVPQLQTGHWRARVIGFNVQAGLAQDFSLVGFAYPQLADIVATNATKVGIPAFNQDMVINWAVQNVGNAATGTAFDYQVLLSSNFTADPGDAVLFTSAANAIGALAAGASSNVTSTVQVSIAAARQVLGLAPGDPDPTLDQLLNSDPFLLACADPAANLNNPADNLVLEHNEKNCTPVQLARLVDVVLVMDRSGSMGENVTVSGGSRTKLAVLKDAANLFLDLMRRDTGDRLAEVAFDNTVATVFMAGGGIGTIVPLTNANVAAARAAVNALAAGGATNIRDALQRGLDLITSVNGDGRRRVVIFFSDGMATAGGDPAEAAFLNQFNTNNAKVFSVGFGTPGAGGDAGIDVDLLQTLSNVGTSGFYLVTQSVTELDKFFVNAVAGAINSNVIVDPVGDIAAGQTQTVPVQISGQDSVVHFIATWDNPAFDLDLALRTPSGLEINAANEGLFGGLADHSGAGAREIITVRLPLRTGVAQDHDGTWQMVIRNRSGSTVRYSASAIGDSTVRARLLTPNPGGGFGFDPGSPIPLQLTLQEDDLTPLAGAIATVHANVPLVSVGTLLAAGLVTADDLARVPTTLGGERLTTQQRLLIALSNRFGGDPIPRMDLPPFELMEQYNPGMYLGQFQRTRIGGTYRFVVNAGGLGANCERFQRETTTSANVSDPVDPNRGDVHVTTPSPGTVVVTTTPMTVGGNFVGAGVGDRISVFGPGLSAVGSLVDNLNGSYTQAFNVSTPSLVQFAVNALGVDLTQLSADLRVPAPQSVTPSGSPNDVTTKITVGVAAAASLSGVTGVSLVSADREVALTGVMVNVAARTVMAQVPAGLEPGLYLVRLESSGGHGPTSDSVLFQVIGRGQDSPPAVQMLSNALAGAFGATNNTEGLLELGKILIGMRLIQPGDFLSAQTRNAALAETAGLLAQGRGMPTQSDLSATASALDHARLDARVQKVTPVQTPVGSNVGVPLGNDVSVMFGRITNPGQTRVTLAPGPSEFPPQFRGRTYLTYDVTTTAMFDRTQMIDVQIGYQDGDFDQESALRVFHRENGRWVDRTAGIDSINNQIMARVAGLSEFVVLEPAAQQTGAITGEAFNDRNGDGTRQAAEPGLPNWTIFLDANGDGLLNNPVSGDGVCDENADELCTDTDGAGNYAFSALALGSYTVRQVLQAGWTAIAPAAAGHAVELTAQAAVATGIDFANADQTAPTLAGVPADQTVETAVSSGRVVTYTAPTATDAVDPAPTVNCTLASGGNFPVGTTEVTCTATDAAGNSASASFDVTVNDTGGPIVETVNRVVQNRTISEIVLTFNESLAPASAVNPANYKVVTGAGPDKVFGTDDDTRLELQTPVYNNTTRTVHLFPTVPPKDSQFFRLTVIGTTSVTDPSGNRLDGDADGTRGGNFVILFGPRIGYIDSNGDAVSISIKTGALSLTLEPDGDGRDLTIIAADPTKSILTGIVKKSKGSKTADGITNLRSITGLDQLKQNSLPASFIVTEPSLQAAIVDRLLESDELAELARPHRFRSGGRRAR